MATISVDPKTHYYLKHLCLSFGTMDKVIVHLIDENKQLKLEIGRLKSKVKGEQDFLKQAHLAAVSRPISIGQSQAQFIPTQNNFAPPPPPPPQIPPSKPRKRIDYKISGNVKKDYVREIKDVFNGDILKPSQVMEMTALKYKDAIDIDVDKIPDLDKIGITEGNKLFTKVLKG